MSKNEMVTISKAELLQLRLGPVFQKIAAQLKMHPATVEDLVRKAVESNRFNLDDKGALNSSADYLAREYVESLRDGHPHMFQKLDDVPAQSPGEQNESLASLPPLERLKIANARFAREADRKAKSA